MKLRSLLALFIFLAGAAAFFFFRGLLERRENAPVPSSVQTATSAETVAATRAPKQEAKPLVAPEGVSQNFASFIENEARSLSATGIDADAAQTRVAKEAAAMGPKEIKFARELALDGEGAANRRILSVYLLMQAGPKAREALWDIVNHTTKEAKRSEAHSMDEVKGVQDRALQIMAIDALAEQAASDPAAREELERRLGGLKDETLRKYILQKLERLPKN